MTPTSAARPEPTASAQTFSHRPALASPWGAGVCCVWGTRKVRARRRPDEFADEGGIKRLEKWWLRGIEKIKYAFDFKMEKVQRFFGGPHIGHLIGLPAENLFRSIVDC